MEPTTAIAGLLKSSCAIYAIWQQCNNSFTELEDLQSDMEMIVDFVKEYARLFEMLKLPDKEAMRDGGFLIKCEEKARTIWKLLQEVHNALHGKSKRDKAAEQFQIFKFDKLNRIRQLLRDLQGYVTTGITILNTKIVMAEHLARRGSVAVDGAKGEPPSRKVDLSSLSTVDSSEAVRKQYADLYEEFNNEDDGGVWNRNRQNASRSVAPPPEATVAPGRRPSSLASVVRSVTKRKPDPPVAQISGTVNPPLPVLPKGYSDVTAVAAVPNTMISSLDLEIPPPYCIPPSYSEATAQQKPAFNSSYSMATVPEKAPVASSSTPRVFQSVDSEESPAGPTNERQPERNAPSTEKAVQPPVVPAVQPPVIPAKAVAASPVSPPPRTSLWYDDDEFDEWA